jgi:hypothetical protein
MSDRGVSIRGWGFTGSGHTTADTTGVMNDNRVIGILVMCAVAFLINNLDT